MKLVRALGLIPVTALSFSAGFGCSDPPAPPAQGAVEITVNTGTGPCSLAGGQITAPADPPGQANVVDAALNCSLSTPGCKPDAYVHVDGDAGTGVGCSVTPNGTGFAFSIALVSGTRMNFHATGQVDATGGTAQLGQSGSNTGGVGLSDRQCKIDVTYGTVKKGAIWARFDCTNYAPANSAGGETCEAIGTFIFENCSSG